MLIIINGAPLKLIGPPLPFRWLQGLEVNAKKCFKKFFVPKEEIVKSLRKDKLLNHIADFWEESKQKVLVFSLTDCEEKK